METMRPPGNNVEGLKALIQKLPNNCTGAEVGSYAGESALLFAARVARLWCVDTWADQVERAGRARPYLMSGHIIEAAFDKRTAGRPAQIIKIKLCSVAAALLFADKSLDFVYIDGAHDLASVVSDIGAWERKVKPDGCLCGHDYNEPGWPGVTEAVNMAFGKPDETFVDHSWLVKGARLGLVQGRGSGPK